MASEKFSTKRFGSFAIFFSHLFARRGGTPQNSWLRWTTPSSSTPDLVYFILPDHAIIHTCF